MKQDNQSYEDRYKKVEGNIKKHEPYLDIVYEELQNFNFVQSDGKDDSAEFSIINPKLLDLDLEESDSVSNAPFVSAIIGNLSLPNERFYEICSQLDEGQQHLFDFIMQYALHCRLAENINELPCKSFQILLSGSTGIRKSFLIKTVTEYLKRILSYPNQNFDQPSKFL